MKSIKYFLLLLTLITNQTYSSEAATEQFMKECGLEFLKQSDFSKEDDIRLCYISSSLIHEAVKAYHDHKISDAFAVGIIILTCIAQELHMKRGIMENDTTALVPLKIAEHKLSHYLSHSSSACLIVCA